MKGDMQRSTGSVHPSVLSDNPLDGGFPARVRFRDVAALRV